MAEIIRSAIIGETVTQIFSGITNRKDDDKSDEATGGSGLERLEMAHIKMEAALEMSDKWQITDVSLLHWRKKLKCAAQECNDVARRCWELSLEEDEAEQVLRKSSFATRIAHATKSLSPLSLAAKVIITQAASPPPFEDSRGLLMVLQSSFNVCSSVEHLDSPCSSTLSSGISSQAKRCGIW